MALLPSNYGPPCNPCCPAPPIPSPVASVIYVFDPASNNWRTLTAPNGILELGDPATPTGSVVASPCSPGGIPGPTGATGAAGANGLGINAFTALTAGFTVPAIAANVTITVASTAWMGVNQILFIASAGFYQVISITDVTHAIVENLGYTGNAIAGVNIASAQTVSPGGLEGPAGASSGVTSVGLSAPSWLSVTGSPVTTAGTLGLAAASGQAQNKVLASPNGAPGAVSLRSLVAGDIPSIDFSKITTGTVPINQGGTGQTSQLTGFNALSPTTTKGDLIASNGSNNVRFGVGTDSNILMSDSSAGSGMSWQAMETIQASSPATGANVTFGTVLTNETLYLTPAGTLATLTVTLPADANSHIGQLCRVFTTQTLTALTVAVSGGSYVGTTVTTLAQYAALIFQKVAANTWIRIA